VRNLIARAIAVAFFGAACVPKANAMNYSYRLIGGDTAIIDAKGMIEPNEGDVMTAWLKTVPKKVRTRPNFAMVLDSPGGNPFAAFTIGEMVRKAGGNTGVAEHGVCASACVIIWAAGVRKSASQSSQIGVHGAYLDNGGVENAKAEETDKLYEATFTLKIAQQLKMYDAPDNVVVAAIMTPPNDMYWLTQADAEAWGANIRPLGE
jgi:hypothetical protein